MSLNWSAENVKNWEELSSEENWDKTQYIIFSTMWLGIPRLTDANLEEFYERFLIFESVNDMPFKKTVENYPLTYVEKYVGLSTNASVKTKAEFKKHIMNILHDRAVANIRNQTMPAND